MYLENGKSLAQGINILIFAAITYWVSFSIGLVLVVFMGIVKLQESVTDWCPSVPFLRRMGLKKRIETIQS